MIGWGKFLEVGGDIFYYIWTTCKLGYYRGRGDVYYIVVTITLEAEGK